jgi:hypothetical protein
MENFELNLRSSENDKPLVPESVMVCVWSPVQIRSPRPFLS